ncbi:MAG TPA: CaiB/BaiF CoA-transferase family protein [Steroidobacteraceae bacterium]|jgi:crotonobetainyl-CoA:carnitine CoA-transferase CaiB-like acyl-CoA transferase|nr:CaiB/BaiF CoA-transferase family protein [Steroidobacteraceae bacterium]
MSKSAALAGIRVLDLSRILAGPWCTMTLADLGAEVWKIENPVGGDDTRHWMPPEKNGVSTYYLSANRNKRSVAIDLNQEAGRDLIRALAAKADVLVENFRPASLKRWNLDYPAIRSINPKIIYCSISGYGRGGEFEERPGYDFVLQAECGFMAITGEPEGTPMRLGVAFIDLATGMNAVQGILAALFARERTGVGQWIDISLLDSGLHQLANVGSGVLNSGREPKRHGNAHPSIVPYEVFECGDGVNVALAVGNDEQYRRLCVSVFETPELWDNEKYRSNHGRTTHRAMLIPLLQAQFKRFASPELMGKIREHGISVGEVRLPGAALQSPEAVARQCVVTAPSESLGTVRMVASPLRLSETPVVAPIAAPALGQHTREVLSGVLGLSEAKVAQLSAQGIVALTEVNASVPEIDPQ